MNLKLFYDFETTGLPLYSEPSGDPRQPHITEIGARLIDVGTASAPRNTIISTLSVIVKPEGWVIPDDVVALNGITTEFAQQVGIPEKLAIEMLLAMWHAANERVAHNEPFDCRIGRIAIKRLLQDDALADEWKAAPAYCTATQATNLVQVPKAMGNGWKRPTLGEAFRHFSHRDHVDAHRALPDVDASIAVYLGIRSAETPAAGSVVDAEYREVGEAA